MLLAVSQINSDKKSPQLFHSAGLDSWKHLRSVSLVGMTQGLQEATPLKSGGWRSDWAPWGSWSIIVVARRLINWIPPQRIWIEIFSLFGLAIVTKLKVGFDCWLFDFYRKHCVLTVVLSGLAARQALQLVLKLLLVWLHFIAFAGLAVCLQFFFFFQKKILKTEIAFESYRFHPTALSESLRVFRTERSDNAEKQHCCSQRGNV